MKKFLLAVITAIMCIGMSACAPSSVEKAEEKMQEAGYTVVAYEKEDAEGLVGGFVATAGLSGLLGGNTMTALLFETKDAASDFYSTVSEAGAVLDGKWVYWGSEEAVDAFTALF
jgi:hypothetical protein